jgi:hypothetical protein
VCNRRLSRGGAGVLESSSRRPSPAHSHDRHRQAEVLQPRFSTTVEKTVENRAIDVRSIGPRLILLVFPHGERVCGPCFSGFALRHGTTRPLLAALTEAKVTSSPIFSLLFGAPGRPG